MILVSDERQFERLDSRTTARRLQPETVRQPNRDTFRGCLRCVVETTLLRRSPAPSAEEE